jgi:ketosteroid isomerase-like protein
MKRILMSSVIVSSVAIFGAVVALQAEPPKNVAVSANKRTVQKYMDAFARSDHAAILSCLTDDVEWVIPGLFHKTGKAAFDKEIENEAFVGRPTITMTRMTEENDVVVAEGRVRSARKDGGVLNVVFCDVFEMRDGKVKRLTSYLMEIKE